MCQFREGSLQITSTNQRSTAFRVFADGYSIYAAAEGRFNKKTCFNFEKKRVCVVRNRFKHKYYVNQTHIVSANNASTSIPFCAGERVTLKTYRQLVKQKWCCFHLRRTSIVISMNARKESRKKRSVLRLLPALLALKSQKGQSPQMTFMEENRYRLGVT